MSDGGVWGLQVREGACAHGQGLQVTRGSKAGPSVDAAAVTGVSRELSHPFLGSLRRLKDTPGPARSCEPGVASSPQLLSREQEELEVLVALGTQRPALEGSMSPAHAAAMWASGPIRAGATPKGDRCTPQ